MAVDNKGMQLPTPKPAPDPTDPYALYGANKAETLKRPW